MKFLSLLLFFLFSSVSFAGPEFICSRLVSLPDWGGSDFPAQIIKLTGERSATVIFGDTDNSAGRNSYTASYPIAARLSRNGTIWTFSGIRTDSGKPHPFSLQFDRANMKIVNLGSDDNCVAVNAVPDMDFVNIAPGTFMMGSPESEAGHQKDETLTSVTLTKSFEMQTTAVTQAQWFSVMSTLPSAAKNNESGYRCQDGFIKLPPGTWGSENLFPGLCAFRPVDSVSYHDVQVFIAKLNSMQWTYTYRLPTEAEFEYAMRAGTTTPYFWGTTANDSAKYLCATCYAMPYDVSQYTPNSLGLFDLVGENFQFTQDWYGSRSSRPQVDPTGPSGGRFHVRKGSPYLRTELRSAYRGYVDAASSRDRADAVTGFRLVRTLK